MITGARAPIALDWASRIKKHCPDSFIVMTDSLNFPLGRFSKNSDRYVKTSSPKFSPNDYIKELLDAVNLYKINLIIPTCEEIFYLSKYKESFPQNCLQLFDNFNKLSMLHNKFTFLDIIDESDEIKKPKTFYLNNAQEFLNWCKSNNIDNYIIKPVFSRFGSEFISKIDETKIDHRYPIIAQQKLTGMELCSYNIAVFGKVVAHSCYNPKYRAGPGAGIYFDSHQSSVIADFCENFVKKINYTGQIAFDFFQNQDGKIYPIECNPRGTSGLHLLPRDLNLISKMLRIPELVTKSFSAQRKNERSLQVRFAMILFSFKYLKNHKITLLKDFFTTPDIYGIIGERHLHFFQIISFFEIFLRSFKYGFNLKKASTLDIEWDGDEIL